MEFIEGRGVIKCRCGTVNILEGTAVVVVKAMEEARGQTVGETARDRDHRESRMDRDSLVGGVFRPA